MDSSIKKGSISCAFSGTQSITSEKLNGKNYLNWSSAVEIWFLGQGLHDHLTTKVEIVDDSLRDEWQKIDYQLVPLLWKSIEPSHLVHYRSCKSCFEIWQKAITFYANDFQQVYDSVHDLATLQMHDHDLESYLNRAKSTIQHMRSILTSDDDLQKVLARLDQMYMAFVLHGLHKDLENARNQVLTNPNMSTVEELVDQLSRVPSTHESSRATLQTSAAALVANSGDDHGSGVCVNQPQCSRFQQIGKIPDCSSFVHGVLVKSANVSPSQETLKKELEEKDHNKKLMQERLKKELEDKDHNKKEKSDARLGTVTKVARDDDLAEQIGNDVYFDPNGLAENNHQPMKVVAQPDTGKAVESQPVEDPSSSRFTWRIDNFSRMNTKKLYSEIFIFGGYKWRVLIFPKGNNVDYLSMYLDVADSASLPYGWSRYARFSLAVVNQIHKYSMRKDTAHQFNARESDWGFTSFMPLGELYDPTRGYLVNDTLLVEAEVLFS